MEIRMYQAGDESAIVNLFEIVYQRPWSHEQWAWRFSHNPAGNHMIALMWDGLRLVGHYAVSPVDMLVNNKLVKTVLSSTTMTHPDYGGRGIFKKLSSYLYIHLENELGYQFIWGFPNSNSHYGFIKYLEWNDISPVPTLAASSDRFRRSKEVIVKQVNGITAGIAEKLSKKAVKRPVSVVRSQVYLQWRIVEKPATEYDIWLLGPENDPAGIIITKLYPVNSQKVDLNILEWYAKDEKMLAPMLASAIHQKSDMGFNIRRVTMWHNLFDNSSYGMLEKMGFSLSSPVTYLAGRTSDLIADHILDFKNWHISFIDSDVY